MKKIIKRITNKIEKIKQSRTQFSMDCYYFWTTIISWKTLHMI